MTCDPPEFTVREALRQPLSPRLRDCVFRSRGEGVGGGVEPGRWDVVETANNYELLRLVRQAGLNGEASRPSRRRRIDRTTASASQVLSSTLASIRGSLRFCIPIGDRDLLVHLTDGQWSIRLSLISGRHYQAGLLESRESIRADANCVVFRHQCRRRIPADVVCRNGLGKVVTRNRDRCAGNHGSGRIGDRSGD
jgi:hypothetical protein